MATIEKRKYSRPAIKKILSVNSESAINAVETYMNKTLSAIYALDVILFYISDEATSEAANQKVADLFDEKMKFFNKKINHYNKIVEDGGMMDIVWTQEFSEEYLIFSPLCGQYIQLIKKFDILTSLIEQAWLNGHIPSSERKGRQKSLQSHMRNVSRYVLNASQTAMRLAQSAGKEKEVLESVEQIGVTQEIAKEVLDTTKAVQSAELEKTDDVQDEPVAYSA
ncbi:hypothetical protein BS333_20800 (plasmid) [Vibrio azureus]|uniref:Uncharacterized protein n=1 Tax=Vibrio azureus NBRC 104587 TaxID=1219077 RepID=U3C1B7_9VIBR|nr:hypothetical protein [Vibrio azureus]AUI88817.1 hypothetical protein BS333_20800 [Vibrio azureus]GAD75294.1 hypothetical protein VAZ01S_023_00610 [Vibrio azureus NBRC 104587]